MKFYIAYYVQRLQTSRSEPSPRHHSLSVGYLNLKISHYSWNIIFYNITSAIVLTLHI